MAGDKPRKIRIGLIFGGRSGEHEVSLMSAQSVMDAIDRDKYEIVSIGITKDGRWLAGVDPLKALTTALRESGQLPDPKLAEPAALLGDPSRRALMQVRPDNQQALRLASLGELDVILPILHGPYGEDGTVQGLLELAGLPYVGAGVVGSAVAMDKVIFKKVMETEGLPVLPYELVLRRDWNEDQESVLHRIEATLSYPMFTKPVNLGSSVGIRQVTNRSELAAGLDEAARFDRRLVVEQGIDAREIECSVLGNDRPVASIAGEVVPSREFYSYESKYIDQGEAASGLLIPAPISNEMMDQVRTWAVQAYQAIDCAGMARVDFLLDKQSDALYINEINTIPGFTAISMYPKLWEASGLPYPRLIEQLIELALDRQRDRDQTQTSYEGE